MQAIVANRAPITFWIMSLLSLAWNGFGVFDYIMTNIRDPGYLAQFPRGMMDYIDAMPGWALFAWTLGVFGALAGSLLLLMRSRHAIYAFILSLIGLGLSTIYQGTIEMPPEMRTPAMMAMTAVIWIGAIGFVAIALWYRRVGILR